MPHINVPLGFIVKPFINLGKKTLNKALDYYFIYYNRAIWIINNKENRPYIIDKRKTTNVIFCNGNFILVNEYQLFPLKNGSITLKKGFNSSNPEYTNFSKFKKVNNNFNCKKFNRFKDYIVKIEKLNSFKGLIKIINWTSNANNIEFDIFIENAKKWEKINFILLIAIPNEFKNRDNFNDEISLKTPNQYGIFELIIKGDKHQEIQDKFAPILFDDKGKEIKEIEKNIFTPFYVTKKWKIRKPKTKKLIIKHLKDT